MFDFHDGAGPRLPGGSLGKPVKGLRLGIPKEYFAEGHGCGSTEEIEAGIEVFKKNWDVNWLNIRMQHYGLRHRNLNYIIAGRRSKRVPTWRVRTCGATDWLDDDSLLAMYRKTRGAGFGAEVKAPHRARHIRAFGGFYEVLLLEGQKVRSLKHRIFVMRLPSGCDPDADSPVSTVQNWGRGLTTRSRWYLLNIYTVYRTLAGVPGAPYLVARSTESCRRPAKSLERGFFCKSLFGLLQRRASCQLAHAFRAGWRSHCLSPSREMDEPCDHLRKIIENLAHAQRELSARRSMGMRGCKWLQFIAAHEKRHRKTDARDSRDATENGNKFA